MAVALPTYTLGEQILSPILPFATCLLPGFQDQFCNSCLMSRPLTACDCSLVNYCSQKCKTKDWNDGHAVECKSACYKQYCRADPSSMNCRYNMLAFRIYAMLGLRRECAVTSFDLHDGTTTCFKEVVDTERPLKKRQYVLELAFKMVENLQELDNVEVDFDEMVDIIAVFRKNCFPISGEIGPIVQVPIAWGIYLPLGVFKHSCKPTAYLDNVGSILRLRAITDIRDGAKPLINYFLAGHADDRLTRLRYLLIQYNFLCYCPLCDSEDDADVDYDELENNLDLIDEAGKENKDDLQWHNVYVAKDIVLKSYRKICYPYDPRIINVLTTVVTKGTSYNVSGFMLKNVHEDAQKHLRMVYGHNSLEFKKYMQSYTSYLKLRSKTR